MVVDTFTEASEAIGLDLWALCQQGPAEALNRTENTQPAMLAAGIATWRAWQAMDGAHAVIILPVTASANTARWWLQNPSILLMRCSWSGAAGN